MSLEGLERRQLIVVTGKGGVGKSALTAALGRRLARAGRRALVLEVDPRENLHQLLDVPPSGGAITAVGENLYLQNLKPGDVVDALVERQLPMRLLARRVRKSPVYERFVAGAPGLEQMAILGHALRLVTGEAEEAPILDTVVLDAPATGHGLYLLTAPRLFAEVIGEGPVAELATRVAALAADGGRCGVVVVTSAEEMPAQEALELRVGLEERFGREPELLIVNGLYPELVHGTEQEPHPALLELWRRRRSVNTMELERLRQLWDGPQLELPLLPLDRGPELVAALCEHLAGEGDGE